MSYTRILDTQEQRDFWEAADASVAKLPEDLNPGKTIADLRAQVVTLTQEKAVLSVAITEMWDAVKPGAYIGVDYSDQIAVIKMVLLLTMPFIWRPRET